MSQDLADKKFFDSLEVKTRVRTNGRPRINRLLAYRLLMARSSKNKPYSSRYIQNQVDCKASVVKKMRREIRDILKLTKKGISVEDISLKLSLLREEVELVLKLSKGPDVADLTKVDQAERDFDDECVGAMGFSFKGWIESKRKVWTPVYNFCKEVWEKIWEKPPLIIVKDRDSPLGDQLCILFLKTFGDDKKRIRDRKKRIRRLFTFLGRDDLNNRHLTMDDAQDPRPIRDVPEISFKKFPEQLNQIIDSMGKKYGHQGITLIQFKTSSLGRTGGREEGKDIFGLSKIDGQSWVIMEKREDEISFRSKIKSKREEDWYVSYIPPIVLKSLYEIYEKRERGEFLFNLDKDTFVKDFGDISEKIVGRRLKLHDLRKVGATWYYVLGLPMDIVSEMGVGWKDLNTLKRHYLMFRKLIMKSDKLEYREKIPLWFKEGIREEFLE